MKKLLVWILSLLIIAIVAIAGGVLENVMDLLEGKKSVSDAASGIYYLYPDRFEVEQGDSPEYIRLSYLKNPTITYRRFGDRVSIQTPKEHYLIGMDGSVRVGQNETDQTVRIRQDGDAHYINLQDLSALKDSEQFGITVSQNGGYYLVVNKHHNYHTGVLRSDSSVFGAKEDFDEYAAAVAKGGKSRASVRGISSEGVEGYFYTFTENEKEYTFFLSENPQLTGFVDRGAIEDEAMSRVRDEKKQKQDAFVLGWEAVYQDTVDTAKIGERKGLDIVSPTWYTLEDAEGTLKHIIDAEYITWARGRKYKIWPLISNHSDIDMTHSFLASYEAQASYINALVNEAVKHGFEGYNLDFEHIYLSDRDAYSHFVNMFCFEMKKWGIATSVDVNVTEGADNWSKCFDHEVIGNVSDYLVIMAYDEHHATSDKAGSNSSYGWVEYHLKKILELVPAERVVLGVPFYTRVWTTTGSGVSSSVLDMVHTEEFLASKDFEITWDESARQRKAVHRGEEGVLTEVWIEDAGSLEHKVSLVKNYNLAGVAAWRMGFETEDAWEAISPKNAEPTQ